MYGQPVACQRRGEWHNMHWEQGGCQEKKESKGRDKSAENGELVPEIRQESEANDDPGKDRYRLMEVGGGGAARVNPSGNNGDRVDTEPADEQTFSDVEYPALVGDEIGDVDKGCREIDQSGHMKRYYTHPLFSNPYPQLRGTIAVPKEIIEKGIDLLHLPLSKPFQEGRVNQPFIHPIKNNRIPSFFQ